MKNIFKLSLLALLLLANTSLVNAQCQLCHLSEFQAQSVVSYLKLKQEAVLYAGCAMGDIARQLKIENVSYRPVQGKEDYFEVYVEGTVIGTFDIDRQHVKNYVDTQMKFSGVIDIAYVHVRTGGYHDNDSGKSVWDATCLGIFLGYDCDPCVDPFDYPYLSSTNR